MPRHRIRTAVVLALLPMSLGALPAAGNAVPPDRLFSPVATFEVSGEVAEILAATPDGRTVLYTDSAEQEVGFVDLTRPAAPRQTGAVPLAGEPTSVAVTRDGRYALVAVDTSASFTSPSGELVVLDVRTRRVLTTLQLGGQPDSIAVSPDGAYAAIAIENQRDEDVAGGLPPQPPAGFLSVVELTGRPTDWTAEPVSLTGLAGAAFASDPEPEYVDIRDGVAAVTLQENNAIVLVDLASRTVLRSFTAGQVVRSDADTVDDGVIAFDDPLTAAREPDAVQWTLEGNLITADEGDLFGGGRGFTIFSPTGQVLYASGASAEQALAAEGRYPDGRSDNKGAEFEGAEIARLRGQDLLFVGSERGDAVLVYDMDDETAPRLLQVLPTGSSPEGLLAVTRQGLFLTSNEGDGTISVFALSRS